MIKLVITSDSNPSFTRSFDHLPIVIGGPKSTEADLKIEDPALEDRHVQISSQKVEGKVQFYVHNLANDPFSTLNGLPFGRQPISHNDIIQIGDATIRFEVEASTDNEVPSPATKTPEPKTSHTQQLQQSRSSEDPETLSTKLPRDDKGDRSSKPIKLSDATFHSSFPYSQHSNGHGHVQRPASSAPQPSASGNGSQPKLSLKDYYLSEYDEDNESVETTRDNGQNGFITTQISNRWRALLIVFASLVFSVLVAFTLVYFWISDQSNEEEIKAARSVADIAMALTYAQLKNIQPQNQNWTHHDFLKNNLYAVMAPTYTPLAEFDAYGQITNCPYMLRIHTNADSSHFVVIAQPAPSFLQWLIPKVSIAIDSKLMDMRKISDIKTLNRAIVSANSFDPNGGNEITALIQQGKLITLRELADLEENLGFTPPKALSLMRPGAENYVYNAPRYYLLSQTILEQALDITEKLGSAGEVHLLQYELSSLLRHPDFVLYTSEGIQKALDAQKALSIIDPKDKFIVAHIQLTAEGKIASTQLLFDDSFNDSAIAERDFSSLTSDEGNEDEKDHSNGETDEDEPNQPNEKQKEVDTDDPLFLHLSAAAAARQHVLASISHEITGLLEAECKAAQPDFTNRFAKLQQKYVKMDKEEQSKLESKFESICNDYAHLPASELIKFIQCAGLEVAFNDYLAKLRAGATAKELTDDKLKDHLKKIEKSTSWPELENAVVQTNQLLRFENVPDPERLVAFQNTARLIVTQRLNHFILSSDGLSSEDFVPHYLQSLSNILKNSWIVDPETHDFYIEEFELREPHSQ